MNESIEQDTPDRRVCDRIDFNRELVVELEDGQTCACATRNISLGGILLQRAARSPEFRLGQAVRLFLDEARDSAQGYPCRVVRVSDTLLGLQIERKAAARFGMALTRGAFARK